MTKETRKRPRIGDIIEVQTPEGYAYAQYTHKHERPPKYGELIRVFMGIHESRPEDLSALIDQSDFYFVFFPVATAVRRDLVEIVGSGAIPEECRRFPLFRAGIRDPQIGRVRTWWLWDGEREWQVGQLTPEQFELPLRQVWNYAMLVHRIVQGWKPADEV